MLPRLRGKVLNITAVNDTAMLIAVTPATPFSANQRRKAAVCSISSPVLSVCLIQSLWVTLSPSETAVAHTLNQFIIYFLMPFFGSLAHEPG